MNACLSWANERTVGKKHRQTLIRARSLEDWYANGRSRDIIDQRIRFDSSNEDTNTSIILLYFLARDSFAITLALVQMLGLESPEIG